MARQKGPASSTGCAYVHSTEKVCHLFNRHCHRTAVRGVDQPAHSQAPELQRHIHEPDVAALFSQIVPRLQPQALTPATRMSVLYKQLESATAPDLWSTI